MKRFLRSSQWLVPVIIFSMTSFLSCSHRPPSNGGDELFGDMKSQSEASQDTAAETTAVSSEPTASTEGAPEQKADMMNELTSSAEASPEASLTAAELEAAQPTQAPEPMAQNTEGTDSVMPPATDVVPVESAEGQPGEIVAQAADAQPLMPETQATMEESTSALTPAEPAMDAVPAVTENKPATTTRRPARMQEVPKSTIWKKGQTMNRYYFVRPNDTPESVSEMIYGNQEKAKDLIEWNGKSFHVGKLLLFVSNENANDTEMKSLFDERQAPAQEYVVQKGDWLSKIAANTYGSGDSWREIAAVNGLSSPDKLEVGDKLSLFPNKVPTQANQVAKNETEGAPAAAVPIVADAKKMMPEESEEGLAPLPQTARDLANMEKRPFEEKTELASPEIGGFFERHFAAIISALVILIAGFLVIRSFGSKSRDFQD